MHVLEVARLDRSDVVERWSKSGIRTTYIPAARLIAMLRDTDCVHGLFADAIAIIVEYHAQAVVTDRFDTVDAEHLVHQIRDLPDMIAMPDGRKWSAVPIIIFGAPGHLVAEQGFFAFGEDPKTVEADFLPLDPTNNYGADAIALKITDYRQRVLSELDDLGFVVTYESGRYRVGPALRQRPEVTGRYYFAPADRRGDRIVTVDRDILGVQLEIEEFEALLNRRDVRELELQVFLEDHPYFLSILAQPLSHVRLQNHNGQLLVPDLILRPLVAARRDSKWEVLELKLPTARLTAGKGLRRRLSQDVWKAISQLREYGSYFADTRNETYVRSVLGHSLKRPKLAVLIGRANDTEIDAIDSQQVYLNDVRIVTYDEILEQ